MTNPSEILVLTSFEDIKNKVSNLIRTNVATARIVEKSTTSQISISELQIARKHFPKEASIGSPQTKKVRFPKNFSIVCM